MTETSQFRKILGRREVLGIAFGAMIGWGWVVLSGEMINRAGTIGSILAFLLGSVMVALVGVIYGELTSALSSRRGRADLHLPGYGAGGFLLLWLDSRAGLLCGLLLRGRGDSDGYSILAASFTIPVSVQHSGLRHLSDLGCGGRRRRIGHRFRELLRNQVLVVSPMVRQPDPPGHWFVVLSGRKHHRRYRQSSSTLQGLDGFLPGRHDDPFSFSWFRYHPAGLICTAFRVTTFI